MRFPAAPFRILDEVLEGADGVAQASGIDEMGGKFCARSERRIGVDLEADRLVSLPVCFNKRRPDTGEGIEHCTGAVQVHVDGACHELAGIARNPWNPPVNWLTAVRRKSQVAKIRPGAVTLLRIALRVVER